MNYTHLDAYALGYYHGRADGVDVNPYDHAQQERQLYNDGYEHGVGDYCRIDEEMA